MAYADDVTLFSLTVSGLQSMIDLCVQYAKTWRFNFGIKKSKCMTVGPKRLTNEPKWFLDDNHMENTDVLEILGVNFDDKCNGVSQVKARGIKCRRAYYNMSSIGMYYPGLTSETKSYLWKAVCLPSLIYGAEAIHLNEQAIKHLDSIQGGLIKQCLGISKSSHHSHLCTALRVAPVKNVMDQYVLNLWHNIFKSQSPVRDLCIHWLSIYIQRGHIIPGTLLSRVLKTGISPTSAAFNTCKVKGDNRMNGLSDSLHHLIMHKDFNKPHSKEYRMAKLLTRSYT